MGGGFSYCTGRSPLEENHKDRRMSVQDPVSVLTYERERERCIAYEKSVFRELFSLIRK